MKFAEAIRLGAAMGPQKRQMFYTPHDQGTCAIGAALLASGWLAGLETSYLIGLEIVEAIPILGISAIKVQIFHMNDTLLMSREEIARWIEAQPEINCEIRTPPPYLAESRAAQRQVEADAIAKIQQPSNGGAYQWTPMYTATLTNLKPSAFSWDEAMKPLEDSEPELAGVS